jgi:hypothetical protein
MYRHTLLHFNNTPVVITSPRICNSFAKFHRSIINVWSSRGFRRFRCAYLAPSQAQSLTTVYFVCVSRYVVGQNSSVSIATRYGLNGPGIECRWQRDFPQPSTAALGPTQPPIQWVPGLSRGYRSRGVALTTHPHPRPTLKKE